MSVREGGARDMQHCLSNTHKQKCIVSLHCSEVLFLVQSYNTDKRPNNN